MWPFGQNKPDPKRLVACLLETKQLIDGSDESFSINGLSDAEISMDLQIAIDQLEGGESTDSVHLRTLFAPTGAIQDIAIDEGWGERYLELAAEFDAATKSKS